MASRPRKHFPMKGLHLGVPWCHSENWLKLWASKQITNKYGNTGTMGLFVSINLSFWCWILVKSFLGLWRGLNIKHHQALWVTLAPFWLANLCGLESQDLHKVWQSLGTTEMSSTFWPECLTNFPNHRSLGRFRGHVSCRPNWDER